MSYTYHYRCAVCVRLWGLCSTQPTHSTLLSFHPFPSLPLSTKHFVKGGWKPCYRLQAKFRGEPFCVLRHSTLCFLRLEGLPHGVNDSGPRQVFASVTYGSATGANHSALVPHDLMLCHTPTNLQHIWCILL